MAIAHSIAPHLPYLRRFARALNGTRQAAMLMLRRRWRRWSPILPSFQRIFLPGWHCTEFSSSSGPPPMTAAVRSARPRPGRRNLEALTPSTRQAFLLVAVEGFTLDEVASILGRTPEETSELIDAAGREIAEQVATSVLIIEDEPIIALDIEGMVRDLGHDVTGVARTHRAAVSLVHSRTPGLVLADIQLADGSSGLDAVNEILTEIEVPVIFITAFPERLLTGEKPEPAFLITKPFRPEAVKAAISQALFFDRKASRRPR